MVFAGLIIYIDLQLGWYRRIFYVLVLERFFMKCMTSTTFVPTTFVPTTFVATMFVPMRAAHDQP